MAAYHFDAKVVSRSKGRSIVAAAAYRAAQKIFDEHIGKTHDYSRKRGVVHSEILAPGNTPEWMLDRPRLWNAVEEQENRKDSQLARDVLFILPVELSEEGRLNATRSFINEQFVSKGMVADFSIHEHDSWNPHVHVLLSMRSIDGESFGRKAREWNDKKLVPEWRREWANVANIELEKEGHDVRIDHRSLADRGIQLEPGIKIGVPRKRWKTDRRQVIQERLEEYEKISAKNGKRILKDPEIALNSITQKKSTFTQRDLEKWLFTKTGGQKQFHEALERVLASENLVRLGQNKFGDERMTTERVLDEEQRVIAQSRILFQRKNHFVKEKIAKEAEKNRPLLKSQKEALRHVTRASGDIAIVEGYAGSGKSYMLRSAREAWEAQGYRVLGATLSGKQAEGLEVSSGIKSQSLSWWEVAWEKGHKKLTEDDVLVIDEAGMIGTRRMLGLLEKILTSGAKLVVVGDRGQIPAIEAGAPFRKLVETIGHATMSEIVRQKVEWQKEATQVMGEGRMPEALKTYLSHGSLLGHETNEEALKAVVEAWQGKRSEDPSASILMLAHRRNDVAALNKEARQLRRARRELGPDVELKVREGTRAFAKNDRVYFLENNSFLGVTNGTLGTIEKIDGQIMVVQSDAGAQVIFDVGDYDQVTHGYAGTLHKGQGATADYGLIFGSKSMDRQLAYVALSRHVKDVELHWSKEEFKDERGLITGLSRDNSKDMALDYDKPHRTGFVDLLLQLQAEELMEVEREQDLEAPSPSLHEIARRSSTTEVVLRQQPEVARLELRATSAQEAYDLAVRAREEVEKKGWVAAKISRLGLTEDAVVFRSERQTRKELDKAQLALEKIVLEPAVREKAVKDAEAAFQQTKEVKWALEELQGLTKRESTFSATELAEWFKTKNPEREPVDLLSAQTYLINSGDIVGVGADKWGEVKFTTRDLLEAERELSTRIVRLHGAFRHNVDPVSVEAAKSLRERSGKPLTEQQVSALSYLTQGSGSIAVVEGYAGSGKNHMLKAACEVWEKEGYRIVGGALAAKIAKELEASTGAECQSLTAWQDAWAQSKDALSDQDIFIIDEASMVGSKRMRDITRFVEDAGAKLVLIGDRTQLGAIEAGAPLRFIADRLGGVRLTEVVRQEDERERKATEALGRGEVDEAFDLYKKTGRIVEHGSQEQAVEAVVAAWDDRRKKSPEMSQIILAHRRDDVESLNNAARKIRIEREELGEDIRVKTRNGDRDFAVGDQVAFLNNDKRLDVRNGTVGTVKTLSHSFMLVTLGDGREVGVNTRSYRDIDHGYALTLHKGQGLTVDYAHILAFPSFDFGATYVALSRHRKCVGLHWSTEVFQNETRLREALSRDRSKDMALDYLETPAGDPSYNKMGAAELRRRHGKLQRKVREGVELPESLVRSHPYVEELQTRIHAVENHYRGAVKERKSLTGNSLDFETVYGAEEAFRKDLGQLRSSFESFLSRPDLQREVQREHKFRTEALENAKAQLKRIEPWHRLAEARQALGSIEPANTHAYKTRTDAMDGVLKGWEVNQNENPEHSQVIVAKDTNDVRVLNKRTRALLRATEELGRDRRVDTHVGYQVFAPGDRVRFFKPQEQLKVKKDVLGTIDRFIDGGTMVVRLDDGIHVVLDEAQQKDLGYGYAVPASGSRNIHADRVHVLAGDGFDRRLTQQVLSRHGKSLQLHWSRDEFQDWGHVERSILGLSSRTGVGRSSGRLKERTIDRDKQVDGQSRAAETDYEKMSFAELQKTQIELMAVSRKTERTVEEVLVTLPEIAEAGQRFSERSNEYKKSSREWEKFQKKHPLRAKAAKKGIGKQSELYRNRESQRAELETTRKSYNELLYDPELQSRAQQVAKNEKRNIAEAAKELDKIRPHYEKSMTMEKSKERAKQLEIDGDGGLKR